MQDLGDKLPPGTAVIIAIVDGDDRLAAEQAMAGSLAKSVAAMDKNGLQELQSALAEAAGKFSPDRAVLPIPDRTFGGTAGRTIDQSVPDWTMIPGPQAPEDAPNVLIDDAGSVALTPLAGRFPPRPSPGCSRRASHTTAST